MSHPYHHHVHYRPRCGGLFKGVLLVGLGFWIARATERRHHLEGPRHFPPPNSNAGSSTATPAENSEGVWGRGGWCRRRREDMTAGPAGPVAYGGGEVRGEDVPAVLAALAAFQRAHPEAAQNPQPQPQPAAPTTPPTPTTASAVEAVIEKTSGEAPAAVEVSAEVTVDKARMNEELQRIDRMAAALQKLREAIEKDEPPRLV